MQFLRPGCIVANEIFLVGGIPQTARSSLADAALETGTGFQFCHTRDGAAWRWDVGEVEVVVKRNRVDRWCFPQGSEDQPQIARAQELGRRGIVENGVGAKWIGVCGECARPRVPEREYVTTPTAVGAPFAVAKPGT